MNIEIANRLAELRKKKGLSQEELAEKLGISRQAVSKWETAAASPDTDNLICLAKLYGVSLDSLLNTEESVEDIVRDKQEETEEKRRHSSFNINEHGIHVEDEDGTVVIDKTGIHVTDRKDKEDVHITADTVKAKAHQHSKIDKISGIITSVTALTVTTAYLLLGFLLKDPIGLTGTSSWAVFWTLFLLIPIVPSFYRAFAKHQFCEVCVPVIVVMAYCLCGMLIGARAWAIGWVGFIIFPVYYIIFHPIDKYIKKVRIAKGLDVDWKYVDKDDDDDDDDDDEDED